MENKVSEAILQYINKSNFDNSMKDFLKQILNFELEYQIKYEEAGETGKHQYSKKYLELIKECVGD